MLDRYTLPEMKKLWSYESKYGFWLQVELAFLRARMEAGELSSEMYEAIAQNASFTVSRIDELDKKYRHDLIAFVETVQESLIQSGVGRYKEEVHKGLTSYDIEDPAVILQLRQGVGLICQELTNLRVAISQKAVEHKWSILIAHTHGQFAEPSTFGHLLLVFEQQYFRNLRRLDDCLKQELIEGKLSGAVGTYAGMNPKVCKRALEILGLQFAPAETQILQRDRHAAVMNALAVVAGSIEQIARTLWEMMRGETHELQEPRSKNQRGSSAMPQKVNPITIEQLMGMPRLIRAYAGAGLENIATPEFRDISQSCVERVIFPDSTTLVHYMLVKLTKIINDLVIFPKAMKKNLDRSLGTWAAQRVRIALLNSGVEYDPAYEYLQQASFAATKKHQSLLSLLRKRPISESDRRTAWDILGEDKLLSCFDAPNYINEGIEEIFRDCGVFK